ncbi:50S ribosomal protein L25 [Fervidicella metallireducens AeB]|uniref:Large ribosomal subunit protein bL25 n=1 Tax=Fervidicella metallireducens AeB TaxID=1403537 RepID=A0A017RZW6_9CLOT|nr:50S ribosomal protein L25 [Fervidicella metallireducens]EYE89470.1 50S ribosomal protein L25 [Fervidicella metallireducens AeB]
MLNTLHGNMRDCASKGNNHRLRNSGRIPAVVYGLNNPNLLVEFGELEVHDVIKKTGEHGIVELDLNGAKEKVMLKEVQRHPITKEIVHMDFQRINSSEKVHAKVPIVIKGEERISKNGAIAQIQINEVEVECTPDALPRYFTADLSKVPIGGRFTVGDLEVAEEISVLNDYNTIIASVSYIKERKEEENPDNAMAIHQD